jgi:hypothetical protein
MQHRDARFLALHLLLMVALTGCETTDNTYIPGRIPKEQAVSIAMHKNKQYPYPFSQVTRTTWRPEGYWAIDFRDPDKHFGNFYLIDAKGRVVGQGHIEGDHYF